MILWDADDPTHEPYDADPHAIWAYVLLLVGLVFGVVGALVWWMLTR